MKPATTVFLTLLSITFVVWVLRGLGVLGFLPGIVLWLLILLTISAGVISRVQRIQT
ncbi:MAG TPA: hypothetical protein V6C78_32665 [Crinalium sp.]|jgi:hypothetical protein